ncbi:ferritin-like domain-containing protein [Acetobacterium woodii]|uniref:Rubrerythrin n=1 Tax=Acetobacterium woodii (strain ATCC 29683 / DSM 1030 / JCM 2381 / KCTC 1655 / WB1) TaxID=931626 RepID=H6LCM6_ACEWD|nr:ferritin family protein [Acetobacterium woodii]AFA47808.1 rubrerythrin [Acetobacterium woodii DSM 1030]
MNSLEFAINMELDGQKYYLEQAENNKDNSLKTVFLLLAKDEGCHADMIKKELAETSYELIDNKILAETNNVFKGVGDFKNRFKEIPNQIDVYRMALKREQESIDLYKKFLNDAVDESSKKLFGFLVKQEENHYRIFDNLITLIERPEEWVEDAEFGTREEY